MAQNNSVAPAQDLPSLITVEVLSYGGGDEDPGTHDPESKRRKNALPNP